jgi:hypothetical protein
MEENEVFPFMYSVGHFGNESQSGILSKKVGWLKQCILICFLERNVFYSRAA